MTQHPIPCTVRVRGVRPTLVDGHHVAEVHPVEASVRDAIGLPADALYAATLLGWHRGQTPCYGATPEKALAALVGVQ